MCPEKYFRFSQHINSSPDYFAQNAKYILSESVIDQQYRTLDNIFIMSDLFWEQVSESINIRSTIIVLHCQGGSIFIEGGVYS